MILLLTTPNRRIGDVLRQCGMVTDAQLDEAHVLSQREGIRIGEALVRMGLLDHDRLAWALGVQFKLTYVDLTMDMIDWPFVRRFPLQRLRALRMLPMNFAGGTVHMVVADPTKAQLDIIAEELFGGRELVVQLADEAQILEMLDEARRQQQSPNDVFAPMPRVEDAVAWLDDCLEMFQREQGPETRFLVLEQSPGSASEFRVARPAADMVPTVSASLVKGILELLPTRFVEEFPLPGGFAGLLVPRSFSGRSRVSVRVTSLHGSNGQVVVFERLPATEPDNSAFQAHIVRTSNISAKKAAFTKQGHVSFEASLDAIFDHPHPHQFAHPLPEVRAVLCRRVAPALTSGQVIWEASSAAEAALAPAGFVVNLLIIQNESQFKELGEGAPEVPHAS